MCCKLLLLTLSLTLTLFLLLLLSRSLHLSSPLHLFSYFLFLLPLFLLLFFFPTFYLLLLFSLLLIYLLSSSISYSYSSSFSSAPILMLPPIKLFSSHRPTSFSPPTPLPPSSPNLIFRLFFSPSSLTTSGRLHPLLHLLSNSSSKHVEIQIISGWIVSYLNLTPSNIPVLISEGHTVVKCIPVFPWLANSRRNDSIKPTAANFDEQ